MLKFDKLAWRGCGVCAVRQFHFWSRAFTTWIVPSCERCVLGGGCLVGSAIFWLPTQPRPGTSFLPLAHHVGPIVFWWKVGL